MKTCSNCVYCYCPSHDEVICEEAGIILMGEYAQEQINIDSETPGFCPGFERKQ